MKSKHTFKYLIISPETLFVKRFISLIDNYEYDYFGKVSKLYLDSLL